MRPSCLSCARKHLAEAMVIADELPEYDGNVECDHWWLMIGHLAQAESHLKRRHPIVAQRIRQIRTTLTDLHDLDVRQAYDSFDEIDLNEIILELNEIVTSERSKG